MRALSVVVALVATIGFTDSHIAKCAATTPATIDSMATGTSPSGWNYYANTGKWLLLLGFPERYELSDGTSWQAGGGSFSSGYLQLVSETVTDGTIYYTMQMHPDSSFLMQYRDYDSGTHASRGELALSGSLVIEANVGSTTATAQGSALIVSNDIGNVQPPQVFHYYTASVGQIVPFTASYTLLDSTWTSGVFSRNFRCGMSAQIDFTHPVPEPSTFVLLGAGSVGLLAFAWRRGKA